jgi:hypothetical protein
MAIRDARRAHSRCGRICRSGGWGDGVGREIGGWDGRWGKYRARLPERVYWDGVLQVGVGGDAAAGGDGVGMAGPCIPHQRRRVGDGAGLGLSWAGPRTCRSLTGFYLFFFPFF